MKKLFSLFGIDITIFDVILNLFILGIIILTGILFTDSYLNVDNFYKRSNKNYLEIYTKLLTVDRETKIKVIDFQCSKIPNNYMPLYNYIPLFPTPKFDTVLNLEKRWLEKNNNDTVKLAKIRVYAFSKLRVRAFTTIAKYIKIMICIFLMWIFGYIGMYASKTDNVRILEYGSIWAVFAVIIWVFVDLIRLHEHIDESAKIASILSSINSAFFLFFVSKVTISYKREWEKFLFEEQGIYFRSFFCIFKNRYYNIKTRYESVVLISIIIIMLVYALFYLLNVAKIYYEHLDLIYSFITIIILGKSLRRAFIQREKPHFLLLLYFVLISILLAQILRLEWIVDRLELIFPYTSIQYLKVLNSILYSTSLLVTLLALSFSSREFTLEQNNKKLNETNNELEREKYHLTSLKDDMTRVNENLENERKRLMLLKDDLTKANEKLENETNELNLLKDRLQQKQESLQLKHLENNHRIRRNMLNINHKIEIFEKKYKTPSRDDYKSFFLELKGSISIIIEIHDLLIGKVKYKDERNIYLKECIIKLLALVEELHIFQFKSVALPEIFASKLFTHRHISMLTVLTELILNAANHSSNKNEISLSIDLKEQKFVVIKISNPKDNFINKRTRGISIGQTILEKAVSEGGGIMLPPIENNNIFIQEIHLPLE